MVFLVGVVEVDERIWGWDWVVFFLSVEGWNYREGGLESFGGKGVEWVVVVNYVVGVVIWVVEGFGRGFLGFV